MYPKLPLILLGSLLCSLQLTSSDPAVSHALEGHSVGINDLVPREASLETNDRIASKHEASFGANLNEREACIETYAPSCCGSIKPGTGSQLRAGHCFLIAAALICTPGTVLACCLAWTGETGKVIIKTKGGFTCYPL